MKLIRLSAAVFALSLIGTHPAMASPGVDAKSQIGKSDHEAIEALLASYTRCVTEHDEAGFRALLLDEAIPFAAVAESDGSDNHVDLRQFEGFRKAVFASGQRYKQKFANVRIEQHGPLAQVSLDFVTEQVSGKRAPSVGWKVLQLVKVGDRWKIASELYTF
ncbi:MAG: nuclear transport factor 2 family protein [Dokdonella sp.]